jgi:hypothetical protein
MILHNNRHSLDIYEKFCVYSNPTEPTFKWMLLGYFKAKNGLMLQHYIADSDNKEELYVWADMHGIIVEKA